MWTRVACLRKCGEVSKLISGGRNVTEGEMPWMVRLSVTFVDTTSKVCGGFILDENWVITAAHCLEQVAFAKISAGRLSYGWGSSSENEQVMIVPITRLHMHPDYEELTFRNDIGLIHLPQSLRFNDHVQPICILDEGSCDEQPRSDSNQIDFCASSAISAGWGLNASDLLSDYLKAIDMNILSRHECQQTFFPRQIFPQHICVQSHRYGEDTCRGDSGGPLFCYQNGKAVAVGIVSFGSKICGFPLPGVYQRICIHIGWMKRIVSNSVSTRTTQSSTTSTVSSPPIGCEVPLRRSGNKVVEVSNGTELQPGSTVPVGTTVVVSCVPGFVESVPNRRSVCTASQEWVPSVGYCRNLQRETPPVDYVHCPDQPIFANAVVSPGNSNIRAQRMVVCNDGYESSSGSSVFYTNCLPSGEWSITGNCTRTTLHTTLIPTSPSRVCPDPPAYDNAVVSPGNNEPGSQRMVVCNDGFRNSNSTIAYISCLPSTLQWTDTVNCERVSMSSPTRSVAISECPNPRNFGNARVSSGGNQVGSQRVVTCDEGFRNGGATLTVIYCQSNLQWSDPGNCEKLCPDVPIIQNGFFSSGSSGSGDRRQIVCFPGFTLVGSGSITCQTNGQWSTPGNCDQIRCQTTPLVPNGLVSQGSNSTGSTRQVSCRAGYNLQGAKIITCLASGEWSEPGTCNHGYFFFLSSSQIDLLLIFFCNFSSFLFQFVKFTTNRKCWSI